MTLADVSDFDSALAYFKQEWNAGRVADGEGEIFLQMSGDPGKMGRKMASYAAKNPRGLIGKRPKVGGRRAAR